MVSKPTQNMNREAMEKSEADLAEIAEEITRLKTRSFEFQQRIAQSREEVDAAEAALAAAADARKVALLEGTDSEIATAMQAEAVAKERLGFAWQKIEALREARREIDRQIKDSLDARHAIRRGWYSDLCDSLREKLQREVLDDVVRYLYARHRTITLPGTPLASGAHFDRCINELFPVNMAAPREQAAIESIKFTSND